MRVEPDASDPSEVGVIHRMPLADPSAEEWEELKAQYAKLDLRDRVDQGLRSAINSEQELRKRYPKG